ncbi:MAG: hypothetical protein LBR98_03575 [Syntrophomonadaceae bacterium]|jgi:fatty-acid desaturase|nr:hypothetical protein [Syntrophomonadaceae bacterium]
MKNKNAAKIILPVMITVITVLYIMFLAIFILFADVPIGIKLLIFTLFTVLAGASVFVLAERIKEIRSGEYDDLSKY